MWIETHDQFRKPDRRRVSRLLLLADDNQTPLAIAIQADDNRIRFCLSTDSDFQQQLLESGLMKTGVLIPEVRQVTV